ncbi:MAG: Cystathionine beta-lyase [Firmicutes bacterium ADurb.Bin153]|nr:MAG: Cystathionine beta-lyase [Firmicutes bacterium ADurb.Bin153]
MSKGEYKDFATKAVHSGQHYDESTGAHIAPMHLTSTYIFTPEKMDRWVNNDKEGIYFYTRMGNPTQTSFEEKLAALEGMEASLVTGSGMAAVAMALMAVASAGDHIISTKPVYGGTYYLFTRTFPRFGLDVSFVEDFTPAELEKALKKNTKVVFFESMHNPCLDIVDIDGVVEWAKGHKLMTVIDNTFATPYLFQPAEHGIDVSVHSTTKYINGHGDHLGGVVIGSKPYIQEVKGGVYQDIGPCPSPLQCWLGLRGVRTLHLRMESHCKNAMELAKWLEGNEHVAKVIYPGLPSHKDYELAKKYFPKGFGGMLAFEVKGGYKEARTFLDNVRLAEYGVSLGNIDTLVQHPATMTHAKVPLEERIRMGVTDSLIRVSVGVEGIGDIIADFERALDFLS